MTKIYKAGEHVKIVRTDPGYDSELGDQTGLVGTVTTGTDSGNAYVTFPHTGDTSFYYLSDEFEQVGTPAPEPVPTVTMQEKVLAEAGLKVGDRVKTYNGVGTVKEHYRSNSTNISVESEDGYVGFYVPSEVQKVAFKVGDWVKVVGYSIPNSLFEGQEGEVISTYDGDDHVRIKFDRDSIPEGTFSSRYVQPAERPVIEPKYKVGDWVQVSGYHNGSPWEGVKGKVSLVSDHSDGTYTYVIETHDFMFKSGGFDEKYLTPTDEPFTPKFKIGDWVEVVNYPTLSMWFGKIGQVTEVPAESGKLYTIQVADSTYKPVFLENELAAAEKPFTPKFKLGDWVKVSYAGHWDGKVGQVVELPTEAHGFTRVQNPDDSSRTGVFINSELTLTTAPPKFKAGDWVKVTGRGDTWDGRVATIVEKVYADFWLVQLDGKEGRTNRAQFQENKLELSEKPAEAHWAKTKPVHTAARIGTRTVVKIEEDKWLFVYHDSDNTRAQVQYRTNRQTEVCLGDTVPKFTNAF